MSEDTVLTIIFLYRNRLSRDENKGNPERRKIAKDVLKLKASARKRRKNEPIHHGFR